MLLALYRHIKSSQRKSSIHPLNASAINIQGQRLDMFTAELSEPILLTSCFVTLDVRVFANHIKQNSFIEFNVLDVTYSTGFRDHQVTQAITTEPVILITQE